MISRPFLAPAPATGGKLLSVGDCVSAALMLLADTGNAGKCYYLEPDSAGYWRARSADIRPGCQFHSPAVGLPISDDLTTERFGDLCGLNGVSTPPGE